MTSRLVMQLQQLDKSGSSLRSESREVGAGVGRDPRPFTFDQAIISDPTPGPKDADQISSDQNYDPLNMLLHAQENTNRKRIEFQLEVDPSGEKMLNMRHLSSADYSWGGLEAATAGELPVRKSPVRLIDRQKDLLCVGRTPAPASLHSKLLDTERTSKLCAPSKQSI